MEKFLSHLSDPVNARIIFEIKELEEATASQLLKKFSDIPQATLYRRLQKMLGDNVLKIVKENPIRGTVEKVYKLGYDLNKEWKNMQVMNDGKTYMQFVTYYMLGMLQEFKEYTEQENIDLKGDGTGLFIAPVYATLEELKETGEKVTEIISALKNNKPGGERKLRNICITITPPKD